MTVNGKRLKKFDIHASNGVIHMITEVIYPFIPDQTIADVVSTDPRWGVCLNAFLKYFQNIWAVQGSYCLILRFSTLLAAVKAADLVDTLASEGPFTVFAPTNEAFDRVSCHRLLCCTKKIKLQAWNMETQLTVGALDTFVDLNLPPEKWNV